MTDVRSNKETLTNVIILGSAFHLIFFAFQTTSFIQQTVVASLNNQLHNAHGNILNNHLTISDMPTTDNDHRLITGDNNTKESDFNAYVGLCITYSVMAVSNWLAPPIVALTKEKLGMFIGSLSYVFYELSFIEPTSALFYTSAAIIGFGAAILWAAQGSFLAQNSTKETSGRNAAIFWTLLQSSFLLGNLFVFFAFRGKQNINASTRRLVFTVLGIVCCCGSFLLLALRTRRPLSTSQSYDINRTENNDINEAETTVTTFDDAIKQFKSAIRLTKSLNMILLASSFLFTGILLTFFTGVFGTAIGATTQLGDNAKEYIGIVGISIGIGELLGGFVFGVGATFFSGAFSFSSTASKRVIVSLGFVFLTVAFSIIYISLPDNSTSGLVGLKTHEPMIQPHLSLLLLASIFIGFGDSCFNTQIIAILMR